MFFFFLYNNDINEYKYAKCTSLYIRRKIVFNYYMKGQLKCSQICHANLKYLFVNGGSRGNTSSLIRRLQRKDKMVYFTDLSRNFAKEVVMATGIDYTRGDALGYYRCRFTRST